MSRQRENRCSAKEQTKRAKSRFGIGSVSSAIVGLVIVLTLWEKCSVQVQAWNNAALPRRVTKVRVEGCADDVHRRAIMATFAASFCGTVMGGSEQAVAAMSMPTSTNDGDDDGVNESSPTPSQAPSSNRPRAPKEALVPAAQQRLLLEQAVGLANLLVNNDGAASKEQNDNKLDQLKELFEPPVPSMPRKTAVSMTRRYKVDEQMVQRANANKLSGAAVRAAMNVYTANLQFGESYILTASPAVKKALIAKYDGLPDVKQVITADLDLRDLYRNQAQTTIEDIQAELYRQEPDPAELVVLLAEASKAYGLWFAFISENDIREAIQRAEEITSGRTEKVKVL
jgi:hypothetical protein